MYLYYSTKIPNYMRRLHAVLILFGCILLIGTAHGDPLPGWNGPQVPITIASTDIPEALSDFPVLMYLSGSSGKTGEDMTDIFSKLGNNAQKIAVTTSDGVTQCSVEIESWDAVAQEAWLWVRVPEISAAAETLLYLYYDPAHADNIDYVGYTGDTAARNVWNDNFAGVWHMSASGSEVPDSTSSGLTGTMYGGSPGDGKIGPAISYPGDWSNVTIIIPSGTGQAIDQLTLESWINYAGGLSPIAEPGFETTNPWTFITKTPIQYTGALTTAWKTEGTYSYGINYNRQQPVQRYGEVSQVVDLSRFSRIWFDWQASASGITPGQVIASIRLEDTPFWTLNVPLVQTASVDQLIDLSSQVGIQTLRFRLSNAQGTSAGSTAFFRIDNARVDMGSIAESPGSFGLFFRGLYSDNNLMGYVNDRYLGSSTVSHDTWHKVDQAYNKATITLHTDGNVAAQTAYTADTGTPGVMVIGKYFTGIIDEIRLSKTARSAAWIMVSKRSADDDLLTFGSYQPQIRISVNGTISDWTLSIGNNTDSTNLSLWVRSSHPWTVSVYDALNQEKPAGTAGYMAEYTGVTYPSPGKVLSGPVRVRDNLAPSFLDLTGEPQTFLSGLATPEEGISSPIVVGQDVDYHDQRLTPPSLYRIIVTFVGTSL